MKFIHISDLKFLIKNLMYLFRFNNKIIKKYFKPTLLESSILFLNNVISQFLSFKG